MALFVILFFVAMPFFLIPILFPSQFRLTGIINRVWAKIYFPLIFIPYKIEYRFNPQKGQQFIFCPNHFSYIDIPSMGLNKVNSIFMGKSDMEKIPLFGYMYRKLHITVDRESRKSRYITMIKAREALSQGKSLVIFPEGGIITKRPPEMTRFKDGAFRAAIEQQIPIVPVTIPYNWIILPDFTLLPKRHLMKVIFHEPVSTENMTLDDLPALKQVTYQIIDEELKKQNSENR
jgi:1-acyl-sn-glycerol-3-phosphate acyltransferase